MLHRVERARLSYYPGALTGKGWLVFILDGRAMFARAHKIHKSEYAAMRAHQQELPLYVMTVRGANYWIFDDDFYCSEDWLEPEDVRDLLIPHDPVVRRARHTGHQSIA